MPGSQIAMLPADADLGAIRRAFNELLGTLRGQRADPITLTGIATSSGTLNVLGAVHVLGIEHLYDSGWVYFSGTPFTWDVGGGSWPMSGVRIRNVQLWYSTTGDDSGEAELVSGLYRRIIVDVGGHVTLNEVWGAYIIWRAIGDRKRISVYAADSMAYRQAQSSGYYRIYIWYEIE